MTSTIRFTGQTLTEASDFLKAVGGLGESAYVKVVVVLKEKSEEQEKEEKSEEQEKEETSPEAGPPKSIRIVYAVGLFDNATENGAIEEIMALTKVGETSAQLIFQAIRAGTRVLLGALPPGGFPAPKHLRVEIE